MALLRRGFWIMIITIIFFLGLNHNWAHAAIVQAVSDTDCPPELEIEARSSVAAFYGDLKASPILACMQNPVLGLNIPYGTMRSAPFMPVIIILGPQGQNIDVASHEYSHAELVSRTSVLLRTYRIPTWFDEGVAMQLDHRIDYSDTALKGYLVNKTLSKLTLDDLSRPKNFYIIGDTGKAHYAFAKCVVSHWMKETGPQGLIDVISNVDWFSEFPASQFRPYESECGVTP